LIFAVILVARPSFAQEKVTPAPASIEKQSLHRKSSSTSTNSGRASTQKTGVAPAPASGVSEVIRVVCALGGVIALILFFRWIFKRCFGVTTAPRATRAVQVLSRSPISPRQQLVILRVGKRLLVVADGGTQMNTLSEITEPDEVAALIGQVQDDHTDRASKVFGKVFNRMRGKYDAAEQTHEDDSIVGLTSGLQKKLFESEEEDPAADDPEISSTRRELSGLMDKVKMLSRQFKG
jgi:flagellar biogenesis protein FliO